MTYAEDFFWYCAIDGKVPENMECLRFEHVAEDFKELWLNKWELPMPLDLPHINDNKGVPTDAGLREYLLKDPKFIEAVEEIYEEEIRHFNFTPW